MTSNDLAKPETNTNTKTNEKNKIVLKAGSMHDNIEIKDEYLAEILHENDLYMDLAMQIISNDKTVRSDTVQDLKNIDSQPLSLQAKKGEQLVSMMPAI